MFGSTEYDNECAGCVYNTIADSEQGIKMILDMCLYCKRAMKPEYEDQYEDLYLGQRKDDSMYYHIDEDKLFTFLKDFIEHNEFDFDVIGEQARSIFTTICIVNNIDVDTNICDYILYSLYAILNEKDIGYSYEMFEGFMIRNIV